MTEADIVDRILDRGQLDADEHMTALSLPSLTMARSQLLASRSSENCDDTIFTTLLRTSRNQKLLAIHNKEVKSRSWVIRNRVGLSPRHRRRCHSLKLQQETEDLGSQPFRKLASMAATYSRASFPTSSLFRRSCSTRGWSKASVAPAATLRNRWTSVIVLFLATCLAPSATGPVDSAYDYGRDDYRGPWSPSLYQQQLLEEAGKGDQFQPLFKNNSVTNVTVQAGSDSAFMPCRVKNLGEHVLHWVRHKSTTFEILTTGLDTYTADDRIQVLHDEENDDYMLQIKYVTEKDAGRYECQISTTTGIYQTFINLSVLVPEAFILGNGDLHVNRGSTITLVCIVEKTLRPPKYVFWSHNQRLIEDTTAHSRITVKTDPGQSRTHSQLTVHNARGTDTGNYTCATIGADAHTYVFVEDDRTSAVQQIADSAHHLMHPISKTTMMIQGFSFVVVWRVLRVAIG